MLRYWPMIVGVVLSLTGQALHAQSTYMKAWGSAGVLLEGNAGPNSVHSGSLVVDQLNWWFDRSGSGETHGIQVTLKHAASLAAIKSHAARSEPLRSIRITTVPAGGLGGPGGLLLELTCDQVRVVSFMSAMPGSVTLNLRCLEQIKWLERDYNADGSLLRNVSGGWSFRMNKGL